MCPECIYVSTNQICKHRESKGRFHSNPLGSGCYGYEDFCYYGLYTALTFSAAMATQGPERVRVELSFNGVGVGGYRCGRGYNTDVALCVET